MTPLEYLVPSRHRRELLRTLRSRQGGITIRQLARGAGMAYSNAHREVRLLAEAGLLAAERRGNALVCRWRSESADAKLLAPLLSAADAATDEDTVFASLKRWKAPLVRVGRSRRDLSLEDTLGRALSLARRHPEVARVWPVVLARNLADADLETLGHVARRLGEKRSLGFFLSLTGALLRNAELSRYARRLHDKRARRTQDFFLLTRGGRARALAHAKTPALARRWRLRMNMSMESFESCFRKFVGRHEAVQA